LKSLPAKLRRHISFWNLFPQNCGGTFHFEMSSRKTATQNLQCKKMSRFISYTNIPVYQPINKMLDRKKN